MCRTEKILPKKIIKDYLIFNTPTDSKFTIDEANYIMEKLGAKFFDVRSVQK